MHTVGLSLLVSLLQLGLGFGFGFGFVHLSKALVDTSHYFPLEIIAHSLPLDVLTLQQRASNSICFPSLDAINNAPRVDIGKYALQGAVAGASRALSRGITFPFDTIKTLEQASDGVAPSNVTATPIKINYFKGVVPIVLTAIPANALFFVFYMALTKYYEYFASICPSTTGSGSFSSDLISRLIISSIATLPQNLFKIPFELLKQVSLLDCSFDLPNPNS